MDVVAPSGIRTASRKRSNRYRLSCGPGPASGWYWTVAPGTSSSVEPLDGAVVEVHVGQLGGAEVGLPAHRLVGVDARAPSGPATAKPWFCEVISILPVVRSFTGWLAPRWPKGSLKVSRPTAWQSSWWPRQMPHTGRWPTSVADGVDDVAQRGRVARAVGQEERVGVGGQQLVGGDGARVQRDLRPAGHEVADDRGLDAGVDRARSAARRRRRGRSRARA